MTGKYLLLVTGKYLLLVTGKYLLLVTGKYLAGHFTTTPFTQFGHRYSVALDPSIAQLHWYFFDLRPGSAYNVSGPTHHHLTTVKSSHCP